MMNLIGGTLIALAAIGALALLASILEFCALVFDSWCARRRAKKRAPPPGRDA